MISINDRTFIANNTPKKYRGRVNFILTVIMGTGFAIGPMVMGNVVSDYGYTISWVIISIIIFAGAACMFTLFNNKSMIEEKRIYQETR